LARRYLPSWGTLFLVAIVPNSQAALHASHWHLLPHEATGDGQNLIDLLFVGVGARARDRRFYKYTSLEHEPRSRVSGAFHKLRGSRSGPPNVVMLFSPQHQHLKALDGGWREAPAPR
jgi:hypothetical protein